MAEESKEPVIPVPVAFTAPAPFMARRADMLVMDDILHSQPHGIVEIEPSVSWITASGFNSFGGAPVQLPVNIPFTGPGRYSLQVELDAERRPHSGSGLPAIVSDAERSYYWHGVKVPEIVITAPEMISVQMIEYERNAEVRRVMIERYGQTRYLEDCGAKCIQSDDCGELYEKAFNTGPMAFSFWRGEASIKFVRVRNSTPEPDGTIKIYTLRVPPETMTAREGVAWTFGMDPREYKPMRET